MTDDPELDAINALVQAAAKALNGALRHAAERDLVVTLDLSRQDLNDDVEVRVGTAPCVTVAVGRHVGEDVEG